jgi:hypothetical protein
MPDTPTPSGPPGPVTPEHAREVLMRMIAAHAERAPNATTLLRLSEAWAWLQAPGQAHGSAGER